ncbi:MAG: hypothetical protein IPL46_00550 [Saprospiraceae bacterium]|nr:hypothetical protein [Saprospiraceae bacterium]
MNNNRPLTLMNYILIVLAFISLSCQNVKQKNVIKKPTICILGGTPSSTAILNLVPDSTKNSYNLISFNRPGFGGTKNSKLNKELLFQIARNAGLKENDFGVIGVSGGAPFAILLAEEFKLEHCGIIRGMVSNEAYFRYADSTFTKEVMETAQKSYKEFEVAALSFPNLDDIVLQAGASTKEIAIRACYNELNYILSESLSSSLKDKLIPIDWWHGKQDRNVAIKSVEWFLRDYKNAKLNIIPGVDHGVDSKIYLEKIVNDWKKQNKQLN